MRESASGRSELGLYLALDDQPSHLPQYRRLFMALRDMILSGRLPAGRQLPPTRQLAQVLGISRNMAKSAYEQLQAEGFICARPGRGSEVTQLPERHRTSHSTATIMPQAVAASEVTGEASIMPLQPGIPALDAFPLNQWRQCLGRASGSPHLWASPPAGEPILRAQIAQWLARQRGMRVSPEQVVVTSGSQQGLDLIARHLLTPGDAVVLEAPGFPGTAHSMAAAGGNCCFWPQHALAQGQLPVSARLLLATPSRNFPLGHSLDARARLAILQWSDDVGAWIIEDDYDSEFAVGEAHTSLFSLSAHPRVIYTGTFSRTMFPGLRLGYLVLPEDQVDAVIQLRRYADGGLSSLVQRALGLWMAEGYYDRHLSRMKRLYAKRRDLLLSLLSETPAAEWPCLDAGGGMHLVLGLPAGWCDTDLAAQLASVGVGSRALSTYRLFPDDQPIPDDQAEQGIVLGFSGWDQPAMSHAVKLFAAVLDTL